MITQVQINDLVQKIIINHKPEKILLFGSYATGSENIHSDIDLLIIMDSDLPAHKRIYNVKSLLFDLTYPLDILVYTPDEVEQEKKRKFSFIYNVFKTSKTLYEKKP